MKGTRSSQNHTAAILITGLVLVISVLSYLNIRLGITKGFALASGLRITFLVICLAFLVGAIGGFTQLSKR